MRTIYRAGILTAALMVLVLGGCSSFDRGGEEMASAAGRGADARLGLDAGQGPNAVLKEGGQGKDGMGYALVIGVGVRNAPPGQKCPVHVFPDAVGVDQRPVHVKQQHGPPPFLGEEPGLAISAPLC